jgi:hypothetical protein
MGRPQCTTQRCVNCIRANHAFCLAIKCLHEHEDKIDDLIDIAEASLGAYRGSEKDRYTPADGAAYNLS